MILQNQSDLKALCGKHDSPCKAHPAQPFQAKVAPHHLPSFPGRPHAARAIGPKWTCVLKVCNLTLRPIVSHQYYHCGVVLTALRRRATRPLGQWLLGHTFLTVLFFRVRVLCQNNPFFGSVFLPKILGREGGLDVWTIWWLRELFLLCQLVVKLGTRAAMDIYGVDADELAHCVALHVIEMKIDEIIVSKCELEGLLQPEKLLKPSRPRAEIG